MIRTGLTTLTTVVVLLGLGTLPAFARLDEGLDARIKQTICVRKTYSSGRVKVRCDDERASGAQLELRSADGSQLLTTLTADKRGRILAELGAGTYRLESVDPNLTVFPSQFTIELDDVTRLKLFLVGPIKQSF